MAVRNWAGSDELRVPVAPETQIVDDVFIGALIKPTVSASFETIAVGCDAAGDAQWAFGTTSANKPFFLTTNGSQLIAPATGGVIPDAEWSAVFFTKFGTGGLRRFHIYNFDDETWDHIAGDLGGSATTPGTTAGGFIGFGNSGTDYLNAEMAVAGLGTTVPATAESVDALVESFVSGLSSNDWIGLGGAWNFNQSDETDNVSDLTGNHVTITGTIASGTDPNGIDGTTIVFGDDPPSWDFTTSPPPLRVTFRFSGGSSNADEALSIGGAESSEGGEDAEGLTGFLFNVLPDFARPAAIAGTVVYRGFYVHVENNGFDAPADLSIWLDGVELVTGVTVSIGVAPEGPGGTMQAIANETTAPTGVSFSSPASSGAALVLGETAADEGAPVWARVTLGSHLAGGLGNVCPFAVEVEPL